MNKPLDLRGKRFGRLVALEPTNRRSGTYVVWRCQCDCGNITYAAVGNLKRGNVTSCGCRRREIVRTQVWPAGHAACSRNYLDGTCVTTLLQAPGARNTSGTVGVKWHKCKKKWIADIQFKGKRYYLGSSENKETAIALRKEAEQRIHGDFLSLYYSEHPDIRRRQPPD